MPDFYNLCHRKAFTCPTLVITGRGLSGDTSIIFNYLSGTVHIHYMDDKPAKDRPTTYGSAGVEEEEVAVAKDADAVKDGTYRTPGAPRARVQRIRLVAHDSTSLLSSARCVYDRRSCGETWLWVLPNPDNHFLRSGVGKVYYSACIAWGHELIGQVRCTQATPTSFPIPSFLQLADAMELMILSVLSPLVKCDWNLSASDEANITTVRLM